MKKITLLGLLLFLMLGSVFAQQSYRDCLEFERLKAQGDGANFAEALAYAREVCSNQNQTGTPTQETGTPTNQTDTPTKESEPQEKGPKNLSSSSTKTGIFVGIAPHLGGTGTLTHNSRTLSASGYRSSTTVYTSDNETKDDVNGGMGLKFGYRFPKWRISYSSYSFEYADEEFHKDKESSFSGIVADWISSSGFFIGGGVGTGSISNTTTKVEESGPAGLFNFGYIGDFFNHLSISSGILSTGFSFTEEDSGFCRTLDGRAISCDIKDEWSFAVSTLYLELLLSF